MGRKSPSGASALSTALPTSLFRAEHVRALDRMAIEDFGIPGIELMERAGLAVFRVLREVAPRTRALVVVCGTGNNGGDGFVAARLARAADIPVRVCVVGDAQRLRGDAAQAWQRMQGAGLEAMPYVRGCLSSSDLIVDALLGTGLARDVAGEHALAVAEMNACSGPRISVDIPSGLHADSGRALGSAVRADCTVSFVGLKRGMFTGQGREHCGEIRFASLDIPEAACARIGPDAERISLAAFRGVLGTRARAAHKGCFGHVLIVGGDAGFGGAARIAGEAAGRCGAGLVSLATREMHVGAILSARPELMAHGIEAPAALAPLAERATVIAIGPGLGRSEWGAGLLESVLRSRRPVVLDADALNLLAASSAGRFEVNTKARVFTPHPGEAARLLGTDSAEIEADRYGALQRLIQAFGGVWVLKGAGTLVGDAEGVTGVCDGGNPGMACGGMGDALTGVIASLMAQGLAPREAARVGVCLHAAAGDAAARDGERGLLAGDLMPSLRSLADTI